MVEFKLNLEDGTIKIGGERAVFHCNHYNSFLQKVICDTFGSIGLEMQVNASKEINKVLLTNLKSDHPEEDFLKLSEKLFKELALGRIDLSKLSEGTVSLSNSHYALGIFYKFGKQTSGVCLYAAGFILAVKEILDGGPLGAINISEKECLAMSENAEGECIFEVRS